ncbi:phenazine biosynthesis-like domain-containing protein [Oppia nitens]|uniref:phenazine biosynthesis-like domain-containing protein n=1 Tax=Oppia nitens TaxID=1686743 RepID=UPI0023DB157B|nr:phenazine biosynthesis-like domain-containing protein [Oppia nitens]
MIYHLYIVDAFVVDNQSFTGNPAAVCLLDFDDDITDDIKQKIASEMNLSETAFVAKSWTKSLNVSPNNYTLRWFTPTNEVDLCGHATLATACVIFNEILKNSNENIIKFETKFKGYLNAIYSGNGLITLNFPVNDSKPLTGYQWIPDIIRYTLGPHLSDKSVEEVEYSSGTKKILLRLKDSLQSEIIHKVVPNFAELLNIDTNGMVRGIIVTKKSERVHFLSRYFSPWNGINEDPVTGSAHTVLTPYWLRQYNKVGTELDQLIGHQCSRRGGIIYCRLAEDRVKLSGNTKIVVSAQINV